MSQSQNIYDIIKMYFRQGKQQAIDQLFTHNISQDIASALYDLINNQRNAIQCLLPQDQQYSENEIERVCENDQLTIQNIRRRVRQDTQQQINNSNDQTNNQQIQIEQAKKIILFLDNQQKDTINISIDQINQFQTQKDKLIKQYIQLLEKIKEKKEQLSQYEQQVQNKTNELESFLVKTQLQSVNENSIKIASNNQQFKEKIDNINRERDQIIKNMEDILKQFEVLQSRNTIKQKSNNEYIDQDEYQNIINKIKGVIEVIISMQTGLQDFVKQLESNLENQNNQSKEIIRDLIKKLQGNRQCFNIVKIILESIMKMLNEMKQTNDLNVKRNQELNRQLEEYQQENNKIKEDFQVQINQLKEYYQNEQQGIINGTIKQNNQNCLDISNKYANLQNQFNDQIMLEIYYLSTIILVLFLHENINIRIEPSQQLLQDLQSFINSINDQNLTNDGLEQQWQTSTKLFKKIYPTISNNFNDNQHIYQSFERVQEIKKKIQKYNQDIQTIKQEIENQTSQN